MVAPASVKRPASRAPGLEAWLQRQWQAPDPLASVLLRPLAVLYGLLAALHRLPYATGLRRARHAPRPVIVVGNLVAGGAGKTPTVLALVRQLQALGRRPGVISRGHGRTATDVQLVSRTSAAAEVGDEPLLIHLRSKAPVAVGRDRVAAARALCDAHPEVDLLIADDGLQHHALARDLQLLVFDDRGAGNGRLLPAGPLRQQLPRVLPPRTSVLYTHGAASTALPGAIGRRRLGGLSPLPAWWAGNPADPRAWAQLAGRPVWAAAGLARPEPFFAMLEAQGLQLHRLPLPDHAGFDPLPWPADAQDVVVTEKDAVKLRAADCGATRIWVATLDFDVPTDFARQLLQQLPAPSP
ncbi:MAG TPA: tetraacyldisaccharide 4'-kinase [Aquabacterium sp.]|nr:tetraacyldisaccharide 4'-kinase [Aquabacterium sp.]